MYANIVGIFCLIDDFSKIFDKTVRAHDIEEENGKKRRNRKFNPSLTPRVYFGVVFGHFEE